MAFRPPTQPRFWDAADADDYLDPGDIVFGLVENGVASERAIGDRQIQVAEGIVDDLVPHQDALRIGTDVVLRWLEWHGRRVINGSSVLHLEMSKAAQHMLLAAAGLHTPQTVVAVGQGQIMEAARRLALHPFILKPDQGGKGLGVMLFETVDELQRALAGGDIPPSVDDVWLLQERIETTDPFITRVEFIGGRFHYAVRVYSGGSFELCPADVCEVPPGQTEAAGPRFEIDVGFDDSIIGDLEAFLAANEIEVAGVEFIRRPDGRPVVYDVNTNTNYNAQAEAGAGVKGGMRRIAEFLFAELDAIRSESDAGTDRRRLRA